MYRFLGLHFSSWGWLLWPLRYLMRIVIRPEELNVEKIRELTKNKQVIYVLPRMYTLDAFVLNVALRRLHMPRVRAQARVDKPRVASVLGVRPKPGILTFEKRDGFAEKLSEIIKKDVRVVEDRLLIFPVSIFWGRARERGGRNPVMRLLFPDDSNATSLQKILMLLLHLRNIHIHFGTPLNPTEFLETASPVPDEKTPSIAPAAHRIRRALLIQFNRERTAALGPALYELDTVATYIMRSRETAKILTESGAASSDKGRKKILRYLREIAANYNATTIRALEVLLDFIWTRIFKGVRVRNFDRISQVTKDGHVLWMPCHRSHLDYLLLSYVLVKKGLVSPHIAAGVNLSFWPAGPILRRGGAFFLRRSISGNRLYAHTFSQYVHFLMHNSFPIEFFQEGGRSRLGKLLPPKTGLLSMAVSSVLKRNAKDTYIVPVYFGYDKVMEDDTYARELTGAKKQKESFLQLILGLRKLFSNYGRVDVAFGEPIHFGAVWGEYFGANGKEREPLKEGDAKLPLIFENLPEEIDARDLRVQRLVRYISMRVNQNINAAATASGSALLTTALLGQSEDSIERKKLANRVWTLHLIITNMGRYVGWDVATSLVTAQDASFLVARIKHENPKENPPTVQVTPIVNESTERVLDAVIEDGLRWKFILKSSDEQATVTKNPQKELNLWWYRGTIFHLMALPGLIAANLLNAGKSGQELTVERVISEVNVLRKIWEEELYWPQGQSTEELVRGGINLLSDMRLLDVAGSSIHLPADGENLDTLEFLAELIRPERELYSIQITAAFLLMESKGGFSRDDIVRMAQTIHRTAFLRGFANYNAIASKVYGSRTFDALLRSGVFATQEKNVYTIAPQAIGAAQTFFDPQGWKEFAE